MNNESRDVKSNVKKEKKKGSSVKLASKVSGNLKNGVDNSVTAAAFKSIGRLDMKTKDSWLLDKMPKREVTNKFVKPMKRKISALKEESATFYALGYLGKMLLATKLRIYGTLLLSFGIYSIVAAFVLSFIESQSILNLDYTNVITSAVIVLLSFILIFGGGKKTLSQSLCESRSMSGLLFGLLGVKEENLRKEHNVLSMSPLLAFIFGMILGIASMFVSSLTLIIRMFMLLVAVIIFIIPESGVVLTLIAMPFSSVSQIAMITFYVWVCYIFKLILGRRTFRMTFTDCAVFIFAMSMLVSGTIFTDGESWFNSLLRSGFVLTFILVSTLIRSREWLVRCENAIYISCAAIGIWSVIEYVLKYALSYISENKAFLPFNDIIEKLEFDINSISVFDNYEVLSVYIMLAVFFVIAHYDLSTTKTTSIRTITAFFACLIVLMLSRVWTVWIGFIAGFIVYIVNKNRKSIYYVLILLVAVVLTLIFIPNEFLTRAIELCNFEIPSLLSRFDVWTGGLRMAVSNIFGMGISGERFAEVYQQYAVMGSEGAPHSYSLYLQIIIESGLFALILFILIVLLVAGSYSIWSKAKIKGDRRIAGIGHAGICSMIAMLVYGVIDYSLYDYSLFAGLFMIFGLSYACCKVMREEADGMENEAEEIYYFKREELEKEDIKNYSDNSESEG